MQCAPTAAVNRIADRNRRKHIKLLDTKLAVSRGVIHKETRHVADNISDPLLSEI